MSIVKRCLRSENFLKEHLSVERGNGVWRLGRSMAADADGCRALQGVVS